MLPEWTRLLLLTVGAATLLLGLALWALDLDKRANRAFAALLALKGGALTLSQVPKMAPSAAAFTFSAMPYLLIPIIPVAIYFASVFPRRRGWLGRPGSGWWVVAAVVVLWGFYLGRHELFWTLTTAEPAHPALAAVSGQLAYAAYGPMSLLLWATYPVFGFVALLFIMDYAKTTGGPQRLSHFLVGLGFLVNALFDGVTRLSTLEAVLSDLAGFPMAPWGWAAVFLPALSLVPALIALAYMSWHRFEHRAQERTLERRAYLLAGLALVAGGLPLLVPSANLFTSPVYVLLLALMRLALPVAVTYGLLRYSLFDIDIRVRKGIGYALMASAFGAVYFLASEMLEGRVGDRFGNYAGLGAAALLTLVSIPLSRVTQAIARLIMPGVQPPEMSDAARLYASQFSMLNEDGYLTTKERRCLDQLRERLGLSLQQAQRLEMTRSVGS